MTQIKSHWMKDPIKRNNQPILTVFYFINLIILINIKISTRTIVILVGTVLDLSSGKGVASQVRFLVRIINLQIERLSKIMYTSDSCGNVTSGSYCDDVIGHLFGRYVSNSPFVSRYLLKRYFLINEIHCNSNYCTTSIRLLSDLSPIFERFLTWLTENQSN